MCRVLRQPAVVNSVSPFLGACFSMLRSTLAQLETSVHVNMTDNGGYATPLEPQLEAVRLAVQRLGAWAALEASCEELRNPALRAACRDPRGLPMQIAWGDGVG